MEPTLDEQSISNLPKMTQLSSSKNLSFKKGTPSIYSQSNSSGRDEPQSKLHHQSKENAFESVFDHDKQMELFAKLKTDDTLKEESLADSRVKLTKQGLQTYNKSKVETTPLIPFQLSSSNSDNGFSPSLSQKIGSIGQNRQLKTKKINFGSTNKRVFQVPQNPINGLKTPYIGRANKNGLVINLKNIDKQLFNRSEVNNNEAIIKDEKFVPNLTEGANESIMFHMLMQSSNEDHSNYSSFNSISNPDFKNSKQ